MHTNCHCLISEVQVPQNLSQGHHIPPVTLLLNKKLVKLSVINLQDETVLFQAKTKKKSV